MEHEKISAIWLIMSYSWTEIGLDDEQYLKMVTNAGFTKDDLSEIDKIIFKDVLFSFAPLSFLIIPCCLWMIMPDWDFDDKWLANKIKKWYSRFYLVNFINPFVLLGYPSSLLFAMSGRLKIRKSILHPKNMENPSPFL